MPNLQAGGGQALRHGVGGDVGGHFLWTPKSGLEMFRVESLESERFFAYHAPSKHP